MNIEALEFTALELANLCAAKNAAYGDSVAASADMLRLRYPGGIRPDELLDAIIAARIFDKQSRLVQLRRSGRDLHGEDPRLDIAGYALYAIQKEKEHNAWPGNANAPAAPGSAKETRASTPTNARSSTAATSSASSAHPSSPPSAVSAESSSVPASTSTSDAPAHTATTQSAVAARRAALARHKELNRVGLCANDATEQHLYRRHALLRCETYGGFQLAFCNEACRHDFEMHLSRLRGAARMSIISKPALKRLCTLYSQFDARNFDAFNRSPAKKREDRIAWAAQLLAKPIGSFSDLSATDAKLLIDALQSSMGIAESVPSRRRPKSRREAEKLGTEGRSDQLHDETTILAGDEEVLAKIQGQMSELSWDQEGLRRFLRSRHAPNSGRETIRTLAEANRVYWALKGIIIARRTRSAHPAAHATDQVEEMSVLT